MPHGMWDLSYQWKSESEVAQSCPTLSNPMDCSLSGSSVHGIFQAGTLEWVAISLSRRSILPKNWTRVSRIAGRLFTVRATRLVSRPGIKPMPPALGASSIISNSLVKSFSIFWNFYWDSYRLTYKCKKYRDSCAPFPIYLSDNFMLWI